MDLDYVRNLLDYEVDPRDREIIKSALIDAFNRGFTAGSLFERGYSEASDAPTSDMYNINPYEQL